MKTSLLEAVSPTARRLLATMPARITKAVPVDRGLKVHIKLAYNKTRCGLLLSPAQEDLAECNCKRCIAIAAKVRRLNQRAIKLLNGRRVSPQQQPLIR